MLISSSKAKFDECIAKVFPLFGNNGLSEPARKNAHLQRALLSISDGEYMMSIGSNWSFLIDNHRDIINKKKTETFVSGSLNLLMMTYIIQTICLALKKSLKSIPAGLRRG